MRKGFSLVTAMIFLIVIATLGGLAVSFSAQTSKQTTDLYLKAQADLLLRSSTEYALLAISGHDIKATGKCLNKINLTYPDSTNPVIESVVDIKYFGSGLPAANCDLVSNLVKNPDSNLTVQLDISVTSKLGKEPIRLHRRTIQNP